MRTILVLLSLVWGQLTFAQVNTCVPHSTIMVGGNMTLGSVTITNDTSNLYVDVASNADEGWNFLNVYTHADDTPVPQDSGVPLPGEFVNKFLTDTRVAAHHQVIPLPAACGQPINMAIYSVFRQYDLDGNQVDAYLTWAQGESKFPNADAWSFQYTICCETTEPPVVGCVRQSGYYKAFNMYAKKVANRIPWPLSEDTLLCNKSWVDIINAKPKGADFWVPLAQQWITARLNEATGAATTLPVDQTLADAEVLLNGNCAGISNKSPLRGTATGYTSVLTAYNTGSSGTPACGP